MPETKKPAAAAAPAPAKKAAEPKAAEPAKKPVKKAAVQLDKTDTVKKALWDSIDKTKAKKIEGDIAVQIFADGLDSFYIAVKGGVPEIERFFYHNNNGTVNTSEKELLKLALGGYDLFAAVKSGAFGFDGNLWILVKILELF